MTVVGLGVAFAAASLAGMWVAVNRIEERDAPRAAAQPAVGVNPAPPPPEALAIPAAPKLGPPPHPPVSRPAIPPFRLTRRDADYGWDALPAVAVSPDGLSVWVIDRDKGAVRQFALEGDE